jgi:hypothetical protein
MARTRQSSRMPTLWEGSKVLMNNVFLNQTGRLVAEPALLGLKQRHGCQ